MTVGVGVVGLGFGARIHVPAFERLDGVEVVATCARSGGATYADWRELVADPAVDMVSIATPPATHYDIASAALAAGKAVLCEKPLALDARHARALAEQAAGRPALVGFGFRTVAAFERARELIAAGAIGEPRAARVRWLLATRGGAPLEPSWKDRAAEGGGALLALGIHTLDYLPWLLGPATAARGRTETRSVQADVTSDDYVEGELMHAGGARSAFVISTAEPEPRGHRVEIDGTGGTLVLANEDARDYMAGFVLTLDGEPVELPEPVPGEDGRLAPFARLAARLVAAVRDGTPAEPSFADGARAQALADDLRL